MKKYIDFLKEGLSQSEISNSLKSFFNVSNILNKLKSISNSLQTEYTIIISKSFTDDVKYSVTSWDYDEKSNSCILTINDEGYSIDTPPLPLLQFIGSLNNFPSSATVFIKDNDKLFPITDIKRNSDFYQFVILYKEK